MLIRLAVARRVQHRELADADDARARLARTRRIPQLHAIRDAAQMAFVEPFELPRLLLDGGRKIAQRFALPRHAHRLRAPRQPLSTDLAQVTFSLRKCGWPIGAAAASGCQSR